MSTVAEIRRVKRIHPKKFALWMAIVSMIMFFSAFTSAFIVRKNEGNWLTFPIPDEFFYSTAIIALSSIAFFFSKRFFMQGKEQLFKVLFYAGFVAGLGFVVLQYAGWQALHTINIDIATNQSSSFFYLITGAHVLHVVGGIAALLLTMVGVVLGRFKEPNPKKILKLELVYTYWHFVDILWIYLMVFLLIQQ